MTYQPRDKRSAGKALIVFMKNIREGFVKTRLAKDIGIPAARRIYERLITYTEKVCRHLEADVYIFYSDFIDYNSFGTANVKGRFIQTGADLGDRMYQAFRILDMYEKRLIIGSDCPGLTEDIISEAYMKLEDHDFVLGPANDGGYYLLGLNALSEELFSGIMWSSDKVFSTTKKKIRQTGKTCAMLQELIDIDTNEDLRTSGFVFS